VDCCWNLVDCMLKRRDGIMVKAMDALCGTKVGKANCPMEGLAIERRNRLFILCSGGVSITGLSAAFVQS
jgi:hypothetical protein